MTANPTPTPSQDPFRIGHGYDLHRLEPVGAGPSPDEGQAARPLVIGGIRFDHDRGPVGHSDGDALLHAITDAILGALGLPDIGRLFPDTDPAWAGADSAVFLTRARDLARERGWRIGNLDCTVILQRPKLGPRRDEIVDRIARVLDTPRDRINVKAKTHEGVDAVGQGRAVEAHAVILMLRQ